MNDRERSNIMRSMEQVSAGGVVYRRRDGVVEIVIVRTASEGRWQLPKGLIDEGETNEIAALREVREEAGVDAELIARIDTIDYWFVAGRDGERVRYHKFVHFYLMRYVSGDIADHDHEIAETLWIDCDNALAKLDFKSEREVVKKAAVMIDA